MDRTMIDIKDYQITLLASGLAYKDIAMIKDSFNMFATFAMRCPEFRDAAKMIFQSSMIGVMM